MNCVNVRNLSFDYAYKKLLDTLSFEVKKGEFFGILGPNGSGKSTLMKNMLGLLPAKSGSIEFLGKDIKNYDLKALSKIIGFVPQKSALTMPLLVEDVLLMGRYSNLAHSFSKYSKQDYEAVEEVAVLVRIESFLKRNVLSLSGGEFQRVLLARALLKKPEILLLDEPTSALDTNYALEILALCERLKKLRQMTIIAILHDLNLAALFCEKILFLKDGKIRYLGTCEALFQKEILKEIYDLDCEVILHKQKPYVIASKPE